MNHESEINIYTIDISNSLKSESISLSKTSESPKTNRYNDIKYIAV